MPGLAAAAMVPGGVSGEMTTMVRSATGKEESMSTMEPTTSGARAGRFRFIAGLVVILACVGLLVARGAKNSMVYYITVTELSAKPKGADLHGLRVTGTVVPGTIKQTDLLLQFVMTDGESTLPVSYRGVVPDTFAEEGEVVVEGALLGGGTFEANHLMAKCPSKYDREVEEDAAETATT